MCLDIGTYGVRGIAHRVRSARIDKSAFFAMDSYDTVFAIKSVVDELEKQIGTHFDSAYITGNFGVSKYEMCAKSTVWGANIRLRQPMSEIRFHKFNPPMVFSRCILCHCDMTHHRHGIW